MAGLSLPIKLLKPGPESFNEYGETLYCDYEELECYGIREKERGGQERLKDNIEGGDYTVVWRVRMEGMEALDTKWRLEDENKGTYDIVEVQPSSNRRWWEITARRSIMQGA